jgi:hypothetical protein
MRKIVVVVVVLFAIFTLIRELPASGGSAEIMHSRTELRSALIP